MVLVQGQRRRGWGDWKGDNQRGYEKLANVTSSGMDVATRCSSVACWGWCVGGGAFKVAVREVGVPGKAS